jgi:hypothetical protein
MGVVAMKNLRRAFLKGGLAVAAVGLLCFAPYALAQEQPPQAPEQIVYVCPMHSDVSSKAPGKCPKCNMKLVAQVEGAARTDDFYLCPMHPDVVSNAAGNCPKCQMKLVKSAPPETSEYFVKVETTPRAPRAGTKLKFRFTVFHPVTGKQIKDFNILHDMPFHLFVVGQDFEHFDHIHPDKQADGSFTIETVLPKAGYYKLFCDFFPAGGLPQVTHHNLVTAGFTGDLISTQPKLEGTRFELQFAPEAPIAGRPTELRYHLVDEKTGEPIKDLKPYLGAWGHTLILSEDATDYVHSHPSEMIPDDVDRSKLTGGADVTFEAFFPRPGAYRVWSQFLRGEKLLTVSFTVQAERLK